LPPDSNQLASEESGTVHNFDPQALTDAAIEAMYTPLRKLKLNRGEGIHLSKRVLTILAAI